MTVNHTGAPRRPVKGSWEALLQEAHALARRDDDRAVAHYWRIIDRILQRPSARRQPGKPLYEHLEEALFAAQSYLARRGRFHEAQELCLDRIEEALSAQALIDWQLNRAKLLSWLDRSEDAAVLLETVLSQYPMEIPVRWLLFDLYVQQGKIAQAERLVDDLAALAQAQPIPEAGEDPLALHRPLVFYLRSVLARQAEAYEQAYEEFARAAQVSDVYADAWHLLYRPLIFHGQHELANRALTREKSEASQRFWRGLNGYYQGDDVGSRVEWQQAAALNIENVWIKSVTDWVLAHYYLGDEDRRGLELVLRLLNRPAGERQPVMLLLAALGWAGPMGAPSEWSNVKVNLDFALARHRETLQDHLLPAMYRRVAEDLLTPERFAEIEAYFHADDRFA